MKPESRLGLGRTLLTAGLVALCSATSSFATNTNEIKVTNSKIEPLKYREMAVASLTACGDYEFPLPVAYNALLKSSYGDETKWSFIKKHSAQGLWTQESPVLNWITDRGTTERPNEGIEKYYIRTAESGAEITVIWSPQTMITLEAQFKNILKVFDADGYKIKRDSCKDLILDGRPAKTVEVDVVCVDPRNSIPQKAEFYTFITQANMRGYVLSLRTYRDFKDTAKVLDGLKRIKFTNPEHKDLTPRSGK